MDRRLLTPLRDHSHATHGTGPILQQQHDWQQWPELTIKIRGLEPSTTTSDLWRTFEREGNIVLIELFLNRSGSKDGSAQIKFQPPPLQAFWNTGHFAIHTVDGSRCYRVRVRLESNFHAFTVQSPVRNQVFYDKRMTLFASSLSFGVLLHPSSMMHMHTIKATENKDITLTVDLLRKKFIVNFQLLTCTTYNNESYPDQKCNADSKIESQRYLFEIPLVHLKTLYRKDIDSNSFHLVISAGSPPMYFRKSSDIMSSHLSDGISWTEFESWYRSTAISTNPRQLQNKPLSLSNEESIIDIGMKETESDAQHKINQIQVAGQHINY